MQPLRKWRWAAFLLVGALLLGALHYQGTAQEKDEAERNRRSVYVYVKRNLRYPLFTTFDSPDRCETCSRRFVTTTAPQALMLLNDKLYAEEARRFGARVLKEAGEAPENVIERAYRVALGRSPNSDERVAMRNFLHRQSRDGEAFADAVTDLCHALLNLNEFVYLD